VEPDRDLQEGDERGEPGQPVSAEPSRYGRNRKRAAASFSPGTASMSTGGAPLPVVGDARAARYYFGEQKHGRPGFLDRLEFLAARMIIYIIVLEIW